MKYQYEIWKTDPNSWCQSTGEPEKIRLISRHTQLHRAVASLIKQCRYDYAVLYIRGEFPSEEQNQQIYNIAIALSERA